MSSNNGNSELKPGEYHRDGRDSRPASQALSNAQCQAIVELGSQGSCGSFDAQVMSQLFALGMIDVRNDDRRVVLTDRGQAIYDVIAGP